MGKVGSCLLTLAGLLLAAGAETFTGKPWGGGRRRKPLAFPFGALPAWGSRRAEGRTGGTAGGGERGFFRLAG